MFLNYFKICVGTFNSNKTTMYIAFTTLAEIMFV